MLGVIPAPNLVDAVSQGTRTDRAVNVQATLGASLAFFLYVLHKIRLLIVGLGQQIYRALLDKLFRVRPPINIIVALALSVFEIEPALYFEPAVVGRLPKCHRAHVFPVCLRRSDPLTLDVGPISLLELLKVTD